MTGLVLVFSCFNFVYVSVMAIQHGVIHFQSPPIEAWFIEGATVNLVCQHVTTEDIVIRSPSAFIVTKSALVDSTSAKYEILMTNASTFTLTMKMIDRSDGGTYTCDAGEVQTYATLKVMYYPSDETVRCYSNYSSQVIFENERRSRIQFSCSFEEGNPPALTTLDLFQTKQGTQNRIHVTENCTRHDSGNTKSFSCYLNEALNNTVFLCNVTQQSPLPNIDGYRTNCSFGPLRLIPGFSLSIFPSEVTVVEGKSVNLTCSSNVSEVERKWLNIPRDWQYSLKRYEYSTVLNIYSIKRQSKSPITLQCNASYGNRYIIDKVQISLNGCKRLEYSFCVLFNVSFLVIVYSTTIGGSS